MNKLWKAATGKWDLIFWVGGRGQEQTSWWLGEMVGGRQAGYSLPQSFFLLARKVFESLQAHGQLCSHLEVVGSKLNFLRFLIDSPTLGFLIYFYWIEIHMFSVVIERKIFNGYHWLFCRTITRFASKTKWLFRNVFIQFSMNT